MAYFGSNFYNRITPPQNFQMSGFYGDYASPTFQNQVPYHYPPVYVNGGWVPVVVSSNSLGGVDLTTILSNSTVHLNVPVQVSGSTGLPVSSVSNSLQGSSKRRPLENELIVDPSENLTYLPGPSAPAKRALKKDIITSKPTNIGGLSKWLIKWKAEHQHKLHKQKVKTFRANKALKRLKNNDKRRKSKWEKRATYDEREWIRESKLKWLQKKGLKGTASKSECNLSNCMKKFRKRDIYMPPASGRKSPSILSDMSARSRSPIRFS